MKRVWAILMALIILTVLVSGCDASSSGKVALTVDNASDYLEFNIKAGGDDSEYSSMRQAVAHKSAFMSGTISGISGYTYDNVVVTIACTFTFEEMSGGRRPGLESKYTTTLSETVKLNVGGNGKIAKKEELHVLPNSDEAFKNVKCSGYVIESISGTVREQK